MDGAPSPEDRREGWRVACARFVRARGLDAHVLELLRAFGPPADPATGLAPGHEEPVSEGDFDLLEAEARAAVELQARRIVHTLSAEVDEGQARLFARRFGSVCALLDALRDQDDRARVLRVGLWHRLDDVLDAPAPHALRVRALVDYYYSQGAVVRHQQGAHHPSLDARLAGLEWSAVAEGIDHAVLDGPTSAGPVHVNLLRVGPARLEAADSRGVEDFAAWVARQGAAAATSGGFFLYSEPDIAPPSLRKDPVGLLVVDGVVRAPPVFRRSCLVQWGDGRVELGRLGPEAARLHLPDGRVLRPVRLDPDALPAAGHLAPDELPVQAHNRSQADHVDLGTCQGLSVVGDEVVASGGHRLPVPLNGLVLVLPPGQPAPPAGTRVRWTLDGLPRTAIAGGPRLLRGGAVELSLPTEDFGGSAPPITFSRDETFDQNLLPRLVVGQRPDGTVIFAAIDGRNMERAPGFTLRGSARLLARLGCTEAMNLDGGSSKRMVVGGRVVDLPSTEVVAGAEASTRVRPVNTAILVFPASDGA